MTIEKLFADNIAFVAVILGISLVITVLNQMVASLLGYRATYLKDGIKDLLQTLDPTLGPNLERIANDILTNRLVSDSIFAHQTWAPMRWKLASTIRPERLAELLELVSAGRPYAANVQAILSQVNPSVSREAQLVASTVNALAPPTAAATAEQLAKQLSDKASKAVGRLEGAFNSTIDSVRQRFTVQMRIWTVIFSLIIAFVYHLDVVKIYSQLSTDAALQPTVTAASADLMKKYVAVQPPAPGQPRTTQAELEAEGKKLQDAYWVAQALLTQTKVQLLEVPAPWWPGLEVLGTAAGWGTLVRILVTAALLSLGAPLCYNALKSLVNLRSQVAEQQSKEAKA